MGEKETDGFCIVLYLKAHTHFSSLNHCLSKDMRSEAMSLEKKMLANHSTAAANCLITRKQPAHATFLEETEGHKDQDGLLASGGTVMILHSEGK